MVPLGHEEEALKSAVTKTRYRRAAMRFLKKQIDRYGERNNWSRIGSVPMGPR